MGKAIVSASAATAIASETARRPEGLAADGEENHAEQQWCTAELMREAPVYLCPGPQGVRALAYDDTSAHALLSVGGIDSLVNEIMGPRATAWNEMKALRGRMDGDTLEDLIITVLADSARGFLNARPLAVIDIHDSATPDAAIGQNCFGLLVILRASQRARFEARLPGHFGYECYSGIRRVPAGAEILRLADVPSSQDGLLLDLESGGLMLLFWERDRFRFRYVRMGD